MQVFVPMSVCVRLEEDVRCPTLPLFPLPIIETVSLTKFWSSRITKSPASATHRASLQVWAHRHTCLFVWVLGFKLGIWTLVFRLVMQILLPTEPFLNHQKIPIPRTLGIFFLLKYKEPHMKEYDSKFHWPTNIFWNWYPQYNLIMQI